MNYRKQTILTHLVFGTVLENEETLLQLYNYLMEGLDRANSDTECTNIREQQDLEALEGDQRTSKSSRC